MAIFVINEVTSQYSAFGGSTASPTNAHACDLVLRRLAVRLLIKCLYRLADALLKSSGLTEDETQYVRGTVQDVACHFNGIAGEVFEQYFGLMQEQDDALVESMSILFNLHFRTEFLASSEGCSELVQMFGVHRVFIGFLSTVSWSHEVLLDFLSSSETEFLGYILRYLRHVNSDVEGFMEAIAVNTSSTHALPNMCTRNNMQKCLSDLTASVDRLSRKGLLPFRADVLISRLQRVVHLLIT